MNTLSTEFSIASSLAFVNWLAFFFPQFKPSKWLRFTRAIPVLLSLLYAFHIVALFGENAQGGFSSLDDVAKLFSNRELLLAGWVHYLAFDILVAYSIQQEGEQRGWKNIYLIPYYVFTFLFGPVGYVGFQITKKLAK